MTVVNPLAELIFHVWGGWRCSSLEIMEVLKGTAAGVRYTVHVSGDREGVSTRHHTHFKLGQMTVVFTSGSPPVISEGDQLVVAGKLKGRVLLADAYLNRTALIRGDAGLWTYLLSTFLCFILGAAALGRALVWPLIFGGSNVDEWLWVVLVAGGAFFSAFGFYCLYRWLHIRGAVRLVRRG